MCRIQQQAPGALWKHEGFPTVAVLPLLLNALKELLGRHSEPVPPEALQRWMVDVLLGCANRADATEPWSMVRPAAADDTC